MAARPITFLSDYGYDDEFAGVCRAVIARIAPDAPLVDLTHGIPRHDVRQGAAVLANALPYTPAGVHLAVVDPEVGSERRAVAVRVSENGRVLVGPDNGLLWPALERFGGPVEAADISLSQFRLEPVSATFHGRDVFAPVAAVLAQGASLGEVGDPLPPNALTVLETPRPVIEPGLTLAHVVYIDRYGNAALDVRESLLPETGLKLGRRIDLKSPGGSREALFARTFADAPPGELLLYVDSYGSLALGVNRGSATEELGVAVGDEIVLRPEG